MRVFYCTNPLDPSGPLRAPDWSAFPTSARALCPSHVLSMGRAPRVMDEGAAGGHRGITPSDVLAFGEVADAFGGVLTTLQSGASLLCPKCLSPLRSTSDAEVWVPPDDLPPDVTPEHVRLPVQGTVVQPGAVDVTTTGDAWQRIGGVRTAAAAWVRDLAGSRAGIVGGAAVSDGSLTARLVEVALDGTERVLASVTLAAGAHPVFDSRSTSPPAAGPCAYRVEAQVSDGASASLADVSIALYEVRP